MDGGMGWAGLDRWGGQHKPKPPPPPKKLQTVHIFLSPRFARVVDLLWLGPIFRFYARLYLYFLLATFAVLLSFTPLPRRIRTSC